MVRARLPSSRRFRILRLGEDRLAHRDHALDARVGDDPHECDRT
jgi:hypothetical protein